jgi:hypothetical protein
MNAALFRHCSFEVIPEKIFLARRLVGSIVLFVWVVFGEGGGFCFIRSGT